MNTTDYLDKSNEPAQQELRRMSLEFLGWTKIKMESSNDDGPDRIQMIGEEEAGCRENCPPLDANLVEAMRGKLSDIEKIIFTSTLNCLVGNLVSRKDDFTEWDLVNAPAHIQAVAILKAVGRIEL